MKIPIDQGLPDKTAELKKQIAASRARDSFARPKPRVSDVEQLLRVVDREVDRRREAQRSADVVPVR